MLTITDSAAQRLSKVLAEIDARDDVCLRLGETQEGLKMVLDQQRPGDETVKCGDDVVLVIDAATAGRLDGRTMDYNASTEQLTFS